jgi:hypothetical protein
MKAKKALKKLVKAEALLSEVVDQFTPGNHGVREALDAARGSLGRAKGTLERSNSSATASKASSKRKAQGSLNSGMPALVKRKRARARKA